MATIKDVAKECGVSVTTVSLIINGKAKERRISEETCERVQEAMKKLGYRPNAGARALRASDDVRPIIAFFWPNDNRSSMQGEFLGLFQRVLAELDYDAKIVAESYTNGQLEKSGSPITSASYSAVIIGACSPEDIAWLESQSPRIPIILMNRDSDVFSTICSNNEEIGMSAARLIKLAGYNEAAVLTSARPYVATGVRVRAFLSACSKLDIKIRDEWIIKNENSIEGGVKAAEEYCNLPDRPQMVYADSDSMAVGALYTFYKHGLKLPDDVAMLAIALRNREITEYSIPPCTVVAMPSKKIARSCIETIRTLLASPEKAPIHVVIEPEVIVRQTFR